MKNFYLKAFLFWFVLLAIALLNAVIRELTYKPALEPYIGAWAHQISAIIASLLFFIAIFFFIRHEKVRHSFGVLLSVGLMWVMLTVIFETLFGLFMQNMSIQEILKAYYFWNGELWILVVITMIISPVVADTIIQTRSQ